MKKAKKTNARELLEPYKVYHLCQLRIANNWTRERTQHEIEKRYGVKPTLQWIDYHISNPDDGVLDQPGSGDLLEGLRKSARPGGQR